MRRSVSARIFFGFFLVMIAFGVVTGVTVYRMQKVRSRLELISVSYLQLTQVLGELQTTASNLLNIAANQLETKPSQILMRQVRLAQRYRVELVRRAQKLSQGPSDVSEHDRAVLAGIQTQLKHLERSIGQTKEAFGLLLSEGDVAVEKRKEARDALLSRERQTVVAIRRLRNRLRLEVKEAASDVESDQRYSVIAGIVLLALALMVGWIVTMRARRTLRPLKRLVAGTKRLGSGDYEERVPIESDDELGALAREFNNMAAAIQEREQRLIRSERLAAAGRLASHITHEVRNPLNSISLNTSMIEEELMALPEETRDEALGLCRAVLKEIDRLTEITEDYLRFARLPKPQLVKEDVNEIVSNLVAFMAAEFAQIKVELQLGDVPQVMADENQLRQALLNLFRNAGEAMEGRGTLTVATAQRDGHVSVSVGDTGPGIPQEHLGQILEPFYSTKEHGTGLGLAITQQVLNEHDGRLEVESTASGTTITLLLPQVAARDNLTQ